MKWGGGRADRSAVRPGAADRGLCGWQTPTKREGRGGAGHWQNTWASFWALCTLVTAVILHPAPLLLPPQHTHIHTPPTPSPVCSQLRGLVNLVLAGHWCNHSTARLYRVCAHLSDEVRSRDGGVCTWKVLCSNVEHLFFFWQFSLPELASSLREECHPHWDKLLFLLSSHCSLPVMTTREKCY